MARRVIGWPPGKPASVVGGLTFGGGPIGNYMSHAVAAMVDRLRAGGGGGGRIGLLFGNGGFATHNHSIVLSREALPGTNFPRGFDFQDEADALRGTVPMVDPDYAGAGVNESYTVLYDRAGVPSAGVIVARNTAGSRFLARVPGADAATIGFLSDGRREPVGSSGMAERGDDGLLNWMPTSA